MGNVVELVFDPFLYIGLSVSEMSAYSEAWWALSSVSPLVKRARRHPEIFGEVLDGEQPIEGFHGPILVLCVAWCGRRIQVLIPMGCFRFFRVIKGS